MTNLPQDFGNTWPGWWWLFSTVQCLDVIVFDPHTEVMEEIQGASTLGPGSAPGGIPLKLSLDPAQYRALERIAARRRTTPVALVELLVLNALAHTDVPPAPDSHPSRPHTTYEQATRGFARDQPSAAVD